MKGILLAHVLFFISFSTGCGSGANNQNVNLTTGNVSNSQETKTEAKQDEELRKQIEQIAANAKGRVGAMATILETGESVSLNANEKFPMQSVYKFPIGMAVLRQVDEGKIKLDQIVPVEKSDFVRKGMHSPIRDKNPNGTELSVGELLRFSVSESDGTASDVLLDLVGGAEAAGKYLNEIGVSEVIIADSEKQIGRDWETQYRNWATPAGAVVLLKALHDSRGLSEESRALLLKIMIESQTGANRLKGLLPKTAVVAHKTGTSGTRNGITGATNDIGIITLPNGRHVAVAVFVSDSPADVTVRESVIARIAKVVWDKWGN